MSKYKFTDCVDLVGSACPQFDGQKRYISTGAVIVDAISESEVELVDYRSKPSRANLVADCGVILFAKMQGTKKTLHLNSELADNIFSTGFCAIRANENILISRCLYYLITSSAFLNQKDQNCSGATQKAITNNALSKIVINVPELKDQENIADQLDRIAAIIKMRQMELQQLDELIKARFVELFRDTSNNKVEPLNDNVEEMFIGPFGSALKNEYFVNEDMSYCMVYEQKHAIQKTMDLPTRYVDENKYNELKRFTVLGGDIIVSCRGTVGEIYSVPEEAPMGIMHPSIMKIRLKKDKYCNLFFVIMLEQYMQDSISKVKGSGVKMAVTATELGKEMFIVPDLEEQKAFEQFVKQVDKSKVIA